MKTFLKEKSNVRPQPPAAQSLTRTSTTTQSPQLINWTVTVWPHCYTSLDACYDAVSSLASACRYACFGMETCPDTNREHLQGFVVLEKRMRLTELKKIDNAMHFEAMRGTLSQNWEYCTKEDKEPMEFGERPDFSAGEREKNRWRLARELATRGEYELIDDQIYVSAYTALHKMKYDKVEDDTPLDSCCGIWLWGVPNSGKSFDARARYGGGDFYLKESFDQWFDGYTGQYACILEDVDPEMCKDPKVLQRIKTWTDKWPMPVQTKGGFITAIRPKKFIITSNHSIEECFPNVHGDSLNAIKRRFNIIHYPFPYQGSLAQQVTSLPPASLPIFNQLTADRRDVEKVMDERVYDVTPKTKRVIVRSPPAVKRVKPFNPPRPKSPIPFGTERDKHPRVIDLRKCSNKPGYDTAEEDEDDELVHLESEDDGESDTQSVDTCNGCGFKEHECECTDVEQSDEDSIVEDHKIRIKRKN